MSSHLAGLDAAAAANERYQDKHGHEDPAYLEQLLQAARRQAEAAAQVMSEVYGRYQAAIKAEWEGYTDAEIMASEHLRLKLVGFADRERWASDRMKALGPKTPLGSFTLHDIGEGQSILWRPTFEFSTLGRTPSAEQEAETVEAIRALGEKWAFGRRLLRLTFRCPDLTQIGWACWIEYEPATDQGRVMVRETRFGDEEQLVYGPLAELVSAAVDHVELLKGRWSDER